MANNWYARKIAEVRGDPVPQPSPTTSDVGAPRAGHLTPFAQQQPDPSRYWDAQQGTRGDPPTFTEALQGATTVDPSKLSQQTTTCPNCQGSNVFVLNAGGVFNSSGQRVPVMQCDDCGWPRQQQFSKFGEGNLARVEGNSIPARQLPANHVIDVIGEGGQHVTLSHDQ